MKNVKNITLISNITLEPYWQSIITNKFSHADIDALTSFVRYEEYGSHTELLSNSDMIVVILNFDSLYSSIKNDILFQKNNHTEIISSCCDFCMSLYTFVKKHSNCKIIWFGFEDYFTQHYNILGNVPYMSNMVDCINAVLLKMLENDTYIDLKRIIASVKISDSFENNNKIRWNAPYSKKLIEAIADEIYKQYLIYNTQTKKCLVVDCDNVLWGGILSEDGIEGIQISNTGLGSSFQDFQRFLLFMFHHGVILAICSKNDEEDVLKVFREHSGMILKENNISCFYCNWNNKPANINSLSQALNISLNSIVFVDDSKFELESVKSILPEVTTILYDRNTIYKHLSCFNLRFDVDTKTIFDRTNTYKTNILREHLKNEAKTFEEYIASLNMNIDIHTIQTQELSRISELTNRTNKCTNGVRYSVEDLISKMKSSESDIYTVCLSDRFSNLGVVGVIESKGSTIELFSLSCRALGRGIEEEMLNFILGRHIDTVRFIDTKKNQSLGELFQKNGLVLI